MKLCYLCIKDPLQNSLPHQLPNGHRHEDRVHIL